MDLKITLGGKTYTAPSPRARQFKEYIRMLRSSNKSETTEECEDIDAATRFIISLFDSDEVTVERFENELSFTDAARLHHEYLEWIGQYLPVDRKNAESR